MISYLLQCIDCGRHSLPAETEYLCPRCSARQQEMEPLAGLLRCVYEYDVAARDFTPEALAAADPGLARWLPILPAAEATSFPRLITGPTPLRAAPRLRTELGLSDLWLKDDTVQPTASFKDRASAMAVAVAREHDREVIATASTGNAATALAGQAAAAGIECVIFVPAKAPPAKLAQIAAFGARIVPVDGSYDQAFELSIAACDRFGWYNRNTAYNPYTVEGKKTAALEIWEQLGRCAPEWVVIPTGDGVIAAGIEKGFSDLLAMKLIDRLPRLALIQAEGCAPIVKAFLGRDREIVPEAAPETIADSIRVGVPRAGRWAMQALQATGGVAAAVTDGEILKAIALLGRTEGVFAEPAAAAAIAGLQRLLAAGTIHSEERVVALVTGSGLKDVAAAQRAVQIPGPVEPKLSAVERFLAERG